MGWTDERVETLKKLWLDGLSASQIAKQLGGVTRNAVIGKVHRLGLAGRATPTRTERPRVPSAPRMSAMRTHIPEPPVVEEDPVTLEDGTHVSVLAINDRMCRWPIGDPSSETFSFCGRRAGESGPYCPQHAQIAYQPQQPRKRSGATELARSLRRYI